MPNNHVLVCIDKENRVTIEYFNLDDKGEVISKKDTFISSELANSIYDMYVLHVLKKQDYVSGMIIYVNCPYLYIYDIYKFGILIGELRKQTDNPIDNIQIMTLTGGEINE